MTSKREDDLLDETIRLREELKQLRSTANGSQIILSYMLKRLPHQEIRIPIKELLKEDGFVEKDWDDLAGIVTCKIPKIQKVR